MFFVQHLPPSEENGELDLVALFEELGCVFELYLQVVRVGFRPEPDFLESHSVVMVFLACMAELNFLLIEPLSVIHYPTNRRVALWRDFDEVKAGLSGLSDSLESLDNSDLVV